jgi:hypothetical protein
MRRLAGACIAALTIATATATPAHAVDPEPDVMACTGYLSGDLSTPDYHPGQLSVSCIVFGYDTRMEPVRFSDSVSATIVVSDIAPGVPGCLIEATFTDGTTTYGLHVYDVCIGGILVNTQLENTITTQRYTYFIKEGVFGPTYVHVDDGPEVNVEFVAETLHDLPLR